MEIVAQCYSSPSREPITFSWFHGFEGFWALRLHFADAWSHISCLATWAAQSPKEPVDQKNQLNITKYQSCTEKLLENYHHLQIHLQFSFFAAILAWSPVHLPTGRPEGVNLARNGCCTRAIWGLPKMGVPPVIIHLNRIFPYKPSILGYHHFRKPPFDDAICVLMQLQHFTEPKRGGCILSSVMLGSILCTVDYGWIADRNVANSWAQ